jgi:hypothetical protein
MKMLCLSDFQRLLFKIYLKGFDHVFFDYASDPYSFCDAKNDGESAGIMFKCLGEPV